MAVIYRYQRTGFERYWLRIPQFFRRKGTLLERLEHLFYSEWWEFPQDCTWRVIKQPDHNRPRKCYRRVQKRKLA